MSMITLSSKMRPLVDRAVKTQSPRMMTVLSKESGEEYKKFNYTARMKKTGRPVSPHVTIYSFPIGALSSITNRVAGCALSFGAAGLGAIEIVGGPGSSLSLMQEIGGAGFLIAAPAKFAVAFPIVYHYFGAVRHFAWDYFPEYLENVDVEKSSYALVGSSTLLSAGMMFL
mmetsp:Transcript_61165/g.92490  ORF Transcript_61165/g.92490 Transcript_61165/m.92490 type:complete len:171 (-) Transcript_61165:50-562(-)